MALFGTVQYCIVDSVLYNTAAKCVYCQAQHVDGRAHHYRVEECFILVLPVSWKGKKDMFLGCKKRVAAVKPVRTMILWSGCVLCIASCVTFPLFPFFSWAADQGSQ